MSIVGREQWTQPRPATITPSSDSGALPGALRPLSLRINFSWILAGNIVRALCRYGMLILLIQFCGLATAGRYAIAIALCNPIWAFVMLGLRAALVADARREYAFADYLAVRVLASVIGLLVVFAVVLCGTYRTEMISVVLLVALAKVVEGISDIFRGELQRRERMDRIAVALFIQGLGGLVLMAVLGGLGVSATLVVGAIPAGMILTLFLWDLPSYDRVVGQERNDPGLWRQPLQWSTLAQLSVVAFPLAVASCLIALVPQLPKYYIGSIIGEEAVAVYAMIGYWISLGSMIVAAMGNVAAPRLAKLHVARETRAFVRLLVRLVAMVGAMGVAGMLVVALAAPALASWLGSEYSHLPQLAMALGTFATMLYVSAPLGRALSAMRKFWWQAIAVAVGLLVAMAVLPWAVHHRGMVGAAEAMAFSMGIVVIVSAALVWNALSISRQEERPTVKVV